MYVHCDNCKWSQDDFWTNEEYNPFDFLTKSYKYQLIESGNANKIFNIDEFDSFGNYIGQKPITTREMIATHFEIFAKRIREQRWITYEEYKSENPDGICPVCKNKLTFVPLISVKTGLFPYRIYEVSAPEQPFDNMDPVTYRTETISSATA